MSLWDGMDITIPSLPDVNFNWDPPAFDWGQFDFSRFKMPEWPSNFQFDPPTGWPGNVDFSQWGSGPSSPFSIDWEGIGNFGKNILGPIGVFGKQGFDAYNAWQRSQQMADYNKAYQDYIKTKKENEAAYMKEFQDYLARRKEWEGELMGSFGEAMGAFQEGLGEFQGQIGEAMTEARNVMGQYLAAAKPLLSQSQELLVPAVAALAKGEVPELLEPILNEAKQRATAAAMQSLVSAGMSPEQARASVVPQVEQQATTMLHQFVSQMVASGVQIGGQGLQALQGGGQMIGMLGQLAGAGFDPIAREFAMMMQAVGNLFGGGFPGLPGGPAPAPVAPTA